MPIDRANAIFDETLLSIMAHTIRGAVNHFRRASIELIIRVVPDKCRIIHGTATSFVSSQFLKKKEEFDLDRVDAVIFIHRNANRHLARLCIAHEIYHLLLELEAYQKAGHWEPLTRTLAIESACNQFAWQLCKFHDKFNRDNSLRDKHIYFPEYTFYSPLKFNDITKEPEWPSGIAIDPVHPFWEPPNIPHDWKSTSS